MDLLKPVRKLLANFSDVIEGKIDERFHGLHESITTRLDIIEKRLKQNADQQSITKSLGKLDRNIKEMQDFLLHIKRKNSCLDELLQGVLANQIILSSMTGVEKTICIPGSSQTRLRLSVDKQGRLCFKCPAPDLLARPQLFVNTLPKSGTYFIGGILSALGYQDIEIQSHPNDFFDYREKSNDDKLFFRRNYKVALPYTAQVGLVLPGQYLLSHIDEPTFRSSIGQNRALLSIRDLRYSFISAFRFNYFRNNQVHADILTSANLCDAIKSPLGKFIINIAKGMVALKDDFPVIRFEDLISRDIKTVEPALRVISDATASSMEAVFEAQKKVLDTETHTYSGQHSRMGDFWTPEVEELFVSAGGDVINEELGYPREYTFSQS